MFWALCMDKENLHFTERKNWEPEKTLTIFYNFQYNRMIDYVFTIMYQCSSINRVTEYGTFYDIV